jgi:hypothetical protein
MGNVETYLDTHDTALVTETMGNASHFNAYKRLPVDQHIGFSTIQRQWMARVFGFGAGHYSCCNFPTFPLAVRFFSTVPLRNSYQLTHKKKWQQEIPHSG